MNPTRMFSIFAVLFTFCNANCDVIPENTHYVQKCVLITNLDEYPEITLVACGIGTWSKQEYSYLIADSVCLTKGYKFDAITIFAVRNEYLRGKNTDKLNLTGNKMAIVQNIPLEPRGDYISNSNPIFSHNEFYKIVGFTKTNVILFKWKEIIGYNDGTPELTNYYEFPDDIPDLTQDFPISNVIITDENQITVSGTIVYPNPNKNNLEVKTDENYTGELKVKLYTINGQLLQSYVFSKTEAKSSFNIPTMDFKPGTYIVKIEFGQTIKTEKLIIY